MLVVRFRAAGLAWCLAGAWWPARPGFQARPNFGILAWPDQAHIINGLFAGQARPIFLAWL